MMMKPLSDLPLELKALTTATLMFAGLAVLAGLTYIDVSHRGLGGGFLIGPSDIAATYYGPGVSVETLIALAHIHMLGLVSVFWVVGFIFVHSSFATGWKTFWSSLPFGAFLIDVAGWFLTKANPDLVYITIVFGGLFMLALAVMILLSLYDLWLRPAYALQSAPAAPRGTGPTTLSHAPGWIVGGLIAAALIVAAAFWYATKTGGGSHTASSTGQTDHITTGRSSAVAPNPPPRTQTTPAPEHNPR